MDKIKEIIFVSKGRYSVLFECELCKCDAFKKLSQFKRTKRHYCGKKCYWLARKNTWEPKDQPTWRGGVNYTEAHRRWKKKNPERMSHLKSLRYAREKSAIGSHTLDEWNLVKKNHDFRCAICKKETALTKDHIIPLSKGGSNFIQNIQPLCKSCNSKKHNKIIHDSPSLTNH